MALSSIRLSAIAAKPLPVLFLMFVCAFLASGCGNNRPRYDAVYPTAQQTALTGLETNDFASSPENSWFDSRSNPLSTFSVDVDTASYALVRRFLEQGQLPPKGTVRIEEMVNFFPYAYKQPSGSDPCAVDAELADCVWNSENRLLRVGVKAREVDWSARKPSNLVFLIDVSGSMFGPERLGLVQQSMRMLVDNLDRRDTVSIVVYAGSSGVALSPTRGSDSAPFWMR